MKIIGGHDYYDGAGYGVDETLVFLRRAQEFWETPFDLPKPTAGHLGCSSGLEFHLVLVAGKVYPCLKEHYSGRWRNRRNARGDRTWIDVSEAWHYDLESARAALKRMEKHKDDRGFHALASFRRLPDEIDRHFRETERKAWIDWMIENRIVTGLVSWEYRDKDTRGTFLRANISDLKEIGFFRVLDAPTAHMEISNYIGGVLPSSPDTVEIGNADKIRKAGFSTRTSFRQDPGVKKPRRRRNGA